MDIDKKVTEIICEQLSVEVSEVTPEASFQESLNADSLDVVELIMAFEEGFDIEIPDDDVGLAAITSHRVRPAVGTEQQVGRRRQQRVEQLARRGFPVADDERFHNYCPDTRSKNRAVTFTPT